MFCQQPIFEVACFISLSVFLERLKKLVSRYFFVILYLLLLKSEYNLENSSVRKFLKLFYGLAFVPVDNVFEVFQLIKATKPMAPTEISAKLDSFVQYFENFWLEMDLRVWNHSTNSGIRTTNHVEGNLISFISVYLILPITLLSLYMSFYFEGWHNRLNRKFNSAHPNFWRLVEILKDEESLAQIVLMDIFTGNNSRPKKLKYRQVDQKFENLRQRLANNEISLFDYTVGCSYLY